VPECVPEHGWIEAAPPDFIPDEVSRYAEQGGESEDPFPVPVSNFEVSPRFAKKLNLS
jgi:hypothetical protein